MDDKQAIEILGTMAFCECLDIEEAAALDYAIRVVKKRKSYLRQIDVYQERIKNQALEITHLQAKVEELKGGRNE